MSFLLDETETLLNRRAFLKGGLTLSASALISVSSVTPAFALPGRGAYSVSFRNEHTGESFSGVYRVGNKYLPEAFERINYVLRDFRANEVFPIDPRAVDIVAVIRRAMGTKKGYSVLSGYRSPRTNSHLRAASEGVAKRSLHMSGQAIDVRMDDVETKHLRDLAVKLAAGGVGYYPRSGFVHLDSGAFRTW